MVRQRFDMNKAAGTVSGQQGQRKTKGHFFYFEGHFKGLKISRAEQRAHFPKLP